MYKINEEIALFWAKTHKKSSEIDIKQPISHPLIAHSINVGTVALLFANKDEFTLTPQQIAFLVSLHDIGKILPGFQAKVPECYPKDILGSIPASGFCSGCHTSDGWTLLYKLSRDKNFKEFQSFFENINPGYYMVLLGAVAGHHGQPVLGTGDNNNIYTEEDLQRGKDFIRILLKVFQPEPLLKTKVNNIRKLSWRLNQITVLADWIGSREEWFPYVFPKELSDPISYYQKSLKQAENALNRAGLGSIKAAQFTEISDLFPHIIEESPLQKLLSEIPLSGEKPYLAIIEDMTGSGKTEAALLLAQRLMAEKDHKGLFVALPTMATANAMYERLKQAYHRLFEPSCRPSIALAHGKARYDEGFKKIIESEARELSDSYNIDQKDEGGENIPAEAFCTAWLALETRRALLAQIGVGTIDQALLAILPVRFATVRQAGLAGKVLIIDECHAFDAYMNKEMETLLKFHAAMSGSAILLSATLKRETRQKLIDAFRLGLGKKEGSLSLQSEAYPLVTIASAGPDLIEKECMTRSGLSRHISVKRAESLEVVFNKIECASEKKAAIAWIRNAVDDVIQAARALREKNKEILVFHARFAMGDRLEIEKKVLQSFGKESKGDERVGILLATQVIEQSLDLDFDFLCSDLAPIDLLIQRAGRLWRHHRATRPIKERSFLILSPEPVDEPEKDWIGKFLPKTAGVYPDSSLLWKTARILFQRGEIRSPEDIRDLIEDVGKEDNIPPALQESFDKSVGSDCADRNIAEQNVLDVSSFSYGGEGCLWEKEIKTPTRLGKERVTLRLAVERNGEIIPWVARDKENYSAMGENLREDWSLSEVSVEKKRISSCPPPLGLEEAIKKARENWSRFEREAEDLYLLLVLFPNKNAWRGHGINKDGKEITIMYSLLYGLEWNS